MTAVAKLPEDDDGMPIGYADWYNNRFFGQPVNTARDHDCETAWRAGALHARAALSPAELGGVETEQSIAADCYHWIAECIGTLPGYSVQEHVQTMKETLEACSDFLHDFVPSDEGGCDEAVELARNCRAVLSGRIDQYEPTPRAAEGEKAE